MKKALKIKAFGGLRPGALIIVIERRHATALRKKRIQAIVLGIIQNAHSIL